MAYTQADIDAVKSARADAKGVRVIQLSDGTRTELDSFDDWRKFIAFMERDLNAATHRTHRYAVTSKGT